jgi:hypothetical protein
MRWESVAELTCHLQGSTLYGIKLSQKTDRPSPTKDVTKKNPPLIRGQLIIIGGYTAQHIESRQKSRSLLPNQSHRAIYIVLVPMMHFCCEGGIEEKAKASQGGAPSEVAGSKQAEKPSAPAKKSAAPASVKSPGKAAPKKTGAKAKPAGQKGIMSFFGKK